MPADGDQPGIKRTKSELMEAELKKGGFFGKNCYWISCSLAAGFFMGTGSAIFATHYADLGFEGGGLCGPGVFIIFFLLWAVRVIVYRCRNGTWTNPVKSRVINTETGKLIWSNLIPLLGNATVNVSYLIVMTYAWYFAELGGINQGVVSALLALASLINVVTFYFGFGEKIGWLHLIGVIFMVASVVCIGAAAGSHGGEVQTEEELAEGGGRSKTVNGVLAIVCGLGGPTVVSTQHYLIRKFKPQYDGIEQALDAAVIEFFVLTLFLIPLSGNPEFTITMNDIWLGTAAGMLMCLGRIFVTIGVAVGLAGPAEALMSTHALYQSLLSAIFADQSLTVLEILGVLLGLAGVFFMAFLDTCVQRFKDKAAIKKAKEEEAAAAAAGGDPDKEFFEGAPKNSEQAPAANAIQ